MISRSVWTTPSGLMCVAVCGKVFCQADLMKPLILQDTNEVLFFSTFLQARKRQIKDRTREDSCIAQSDFS